MYVRLAILGVAVAASGWLGYRVADGRCAAAMLTLATTHRDAQNDAVEAASAELKAQSERAIRQAEARGRASAAAQEIINEIHTTPDTRACEWTDDQRLRIERIYSLYGASTGAASAGVSDTVPHAATD